jgi:hypothetical protein
MKKSMIVVLSAFGALVIFAVAFVVFIASVV